jgi:hypothetical protein
LGWKFCRFDDPGAILGCCRPLNFKTLQRGLCAQRNSHITSVHSGSSEIDLHQAPAFQSATVPLPRSLFSIQVTAPPNLTCARAYFSAAAPPLAQHIDSNLRRAGGTAMPHHRASVAVPRASRRGQGVFVTHFAHGRRRAFVLRPSRRSASVTRVSCCAFSASRLLALGRLARCTHKNSALPPEGQHRIGGTNGCPSPPLPARRPARWVEIDRLKGRLSRKDRKLWT